MRGVVESLGDVLAVRSPEAIRDLVLLLAERVNTADQQVADGGIAPTGRARPFFAPLLYWRPRTDSNRRRRP